MRHARDIKDDVEPRHTIAEERLRTHLAVTSTLAEAHTVAEAAPRVLEQVCRGMGWELGALWRVDRAAGSIRCVDLWHMPDAPLVGFSLATLHAEFGPGVGLPGRVWQAQAPLWVPDVGADPGQPRSAQAARERVRSALALPVTAGGEVTGVLEFVSTAEHEPDDELLAFLAGLGSMVGQFIRRRDAERQLRASEARKSAIVNAAFECILGLDAHGGVTEFNPAAVATFGHARERALELSLADLLVLDSLDDARRADVDALLAGEPPKLLGSAFEGTARRADGGEFPVELAVSAIDLPGPQSFTVYLRDITASRASAAAVRHLAAIVQGSNDAILSKSLDGTILTWNRGAEQLYGYTPEEAIGRNVAMLAPDDRREESANVMAQVARGEQVAQYDTVRLRKDGSPVEVAMTVSPILDENGRIVAASTIASDITERRTAQAQVAHLAYHDQLTGLPNRSMFHEHLELALARADRHHFGVAVLFIDLDNFKLINDSFGHEAGDALLHDFGARLKSVTRATDIVARQGGDEFLVLVPDLELDSGESIVPRALEVVGAIENKVRSVLETPFLVADTDVHLGLSIGVSIYPIDATDRDELLRNADTAMYIGKGMLETEAVASGPAHARGRLAMMRDLRRAVEHDEFELHFQPIMELESRKLVGAETLVRWRDANGHLVLPEQFVPLAERSGLIEPITRRVIEGACRQAREWTDAGADILVTFNLPPGLWGPAIVEMLLDATGRAGVEPHRMMIEVTESTVMVQPARAAHTLALLREYGVQLAIDDFGKGHSSLERLRQLPVSTLKIDRSFVSDLPNDRGAAAIVIAIIQLAHSLGLRPLAEGIETPEQLAFLIEHGCDLGQGYLLGRPVPARDMELSR